jgi:hypothetical protein
LRTILVDLQDSVVVVDGAAELPFRFFLSAFLPYISESFYKLRSFIYISKFFLQAQVFLHPLLHDYLSHPLALSEFPLL